MNTPESDYSPPGAPIKEPPGDERGSLLKGFLVGWAVLIGSCVLVGMIWAVINTMIPYSNDLTALLGLTALLPFVSTLALLVWFAVKGKPRSAAGVALTFASLIALVVLLVAACFGLLANSVHR